MYFGAESSSHKAASCNCCENLRSLETVRLEIHGLVVRFGRRGAVEGLPRGLEGGAAKGTPRGAAEDRSVDRWVDSSVYRSVDRSVNDV